MVQKHTFVNTSQNSSSSQPELLVAITWNILRNPLFLIIYLLPCLLNGVLVVTILKDPLKCLRSCSSYLVFNLGLLGFLPLLALIIHILTLSVYKELHLCEFIYCFGFYNTVFAVLILTTDRYYLVCKPLLYSVIITKTRVLYFAILVWIVSGILAVGVFPCVHNVIGIVVATKIFVSTLPPIFLCLIMVIIILNIKTWQTIARHDKRLSSLGQHNRNTSNIAEKKRLENERRFSKVVLVLLLNLMFFVLPQVLIIVIKGVNFLCELCVAGFRDSNVSLLQFYFFPLYFISTPVLYIAFIPKYRKSCRSLFVSV